MSLRIASKPVTVPQGVEVTVEGQQISIKGTKGTLTQVLHANVNMDRQEDELHFSPRHGDKASIALTGTMRALMSNIIEGVTKGFEKKLELKGVGYRAQVQGKKLNLTVGFSHPVHVEMPEGITIEAPTQTEILVKGADKQLVGQIAANIRGIRPPDAYKGKGIRYADEHISLKEAKKK